MLVQKIAFNKIRQFSERDKMYRLFPEKFQDFIFDTPITENLIKKIDVRTKYSLNRSSLVSTLLSQYEGVDTSNLVIENIKKLKNKNCFTVITAHQPSLFTGPLYYIFKILSTINLCQNLNKTYPQYQFIPVFVHGSEDHDFDEINHCYIGGNKITWDRDSEGATGRMSQEGLSGTIKSLFDLLSNSVHTNSLRHILESAQIEGENYGRFTFRLVDLLFHKFGLVQANMDNKDFKQAFRSFIKKEILEQKSEQLVLMEAQKIKTQFGYSTQAFPRAINLFYLDKHKRSRIITKKDGYGTIDDEQTWKKHDLLQLIRNHPERFSPNVVMRPIYQEFIFPNIAYVGGGGEIAYWLERKSQFEYYNISFPVLIRRNSAGITNLKKLKNLNKFQLSIEDLLDKEHIWVNKLVQKNAENKIDFEQAKREILKIYEKLANEIYKTDPTLKSSTLAGGKNTENNINKLAKKVLRIQKKKQSLKLEKVKMITDQIFPNDSLQERISNIFQFLNENGLSLLDQLLPHFDPLESDFKLFILD